MPNILLDYCRKAVTEESIVDFFRVGSANYHGSRGRELYQQNRRELIERFEAKRDAAGLSLNITDPAAYSIETHKPVCHIHQVELEVQVDPLTGEVEDDAMDCPMCCDESVELLDSVYFEALENGELDDKETRRFGEEADEEEAPEDYEMNVEEFEPV